MGTFNLLRFQSSAWKLLLRYPFFFPHSHVSLLSDYLESRSVVSDSLQPHGLHSPQNSPGQNTGVCSLSLLQGIFPTQGSNPGLPHSRWILYQLSYQGSPTDYLRSPLLQSPITISLLFQAFRNSSALFSFCSLMVSKLTTGFRGFVTSLGCSTEVASLQRRPLVWSSHTESDL